MGAAVREAIDIAIPAASEERAQAARRILAAEPMDVPDPGAWRLELDAERARRA